MVKAIGPSLARLGYKNGDSDLAIYRVLRDGITGTAMEPAHLSFVERWQVAGYLRTVQLHSDKGDDEPRTLNIHVSSEQITRANDNPGEWLSYSGSLSGWRYSSLSEITPVSVSQLRLLWVFQSTTSEPRFEFNPPCSQRHYFRHRTACDRRSPGCKDWWSDLEVRTTHSRRFAFRGW